MFRHVAELEVAVHLASAGESADDGTETAAVNESALAQVQDNGAAVAQEPGHMRAQRFALAACNNPTVAVHDSDASDIPSVERKAHRASSAGWERARQSRHIILEDV